MEGLLAFGVACNAIQVIDFTWKAASKAYQVYTLGTSEQNAALEEDTSKLSKMITLLDDSLTSLGSTTVPMTENDQELHELGTACLRTARDLQRTLADVRATPGRKRDRFGKAIKAVWNDSKIQDLQKNLNRHRETLKERILVDLRKRVIDGNLLENQRFNSLDRSVQILLTGLADGKTRLEDFAHDLSKLSRDEQTATRATISNEASAVRDHIASAATANHALVEQQTIHLKHELLPSPHNQILQSLSFPEMSIRQDQVVEAHKETFRWVFHKEDAKFKDSLGLWLESGNRCYWISGKAGSGKSTLMNYVLNAVETEHALQKWAGGAHLIIPRYFFFNPGSPLQKSANGLLRALIHQVLEADPGLTPGFMKSLSKHQVAAVDHQRGFNLSWSDKQLRLILLELLNSLPTDTWVCFFIDGLDEFDGDRLALLETIKGLADKPNVKLCVSSRPWPIFEDALGLNPKLRLQDLTYDCIKAYVFESLEASLHKQYYVSGESKQQIENLLNGITEKACGVFLWVSLVVRDILEGLPNGDTFEHLARRIDALPKKLNSLFEHMLANIQPIYHEDFNNCLSIFMNTRKTRQGKIDFVTFALATWDQLHKSDSTSFLVLNRGDAHRHVKSLAKGFAARTAGLLELAPFSVEAKEEKPEDAMRYSVVRLQLDRAADGKEVVHFFNSDRKTCGFSSVEAIHRSVVEFFDRRSTPIGWLCLRSNEVTAEWLLKGSFLNSAIGRCMVCEIPHAFCMWGDYHVLSCSLSYAREMEAEFCNRHEEILDRYGLFFQGQSDLARWTVPYGCGFTYLPLSPEFEQVDPSTDFTGLVTQMGLFQYALAKLDRQSDTRMYATHLLKCASMFLSQSCSQNVDGNDRNRELERIRAFMICLLRDHGADPVSPFEYFDLRHGLIDAPGQIRLWTAWGLFIQTLNECHDVFSLELVSEFINAGVHNDERCHQLALIVFRPYRDEHQRSRNPIAKTEKRSKANAKIEMFLKYWRSPSFMLAAVFNVGCDYLGTLGEQTGTPFQWVTLSLCDSAQVIRISSAAIHAISPLVKQLIEAHIHPESKEEVQSRFDKEFTPIFVRWLFTQDEELDYWGLRDEFPYLDIPYTAQEMSMYQNREGHLTEWTTKRNVKRRARKTEKPIALKTTGGYGRRQGLSRGSQSQSRAI